MKSKIETDPSDPTGKTFIGMNDYGDDVINLTAALKDVLHQVMLQPEDTPATFDKSLKFIETVSYVNALNTYNHYSRKAFSIDDISPKA